MQLKTADQWPGIHYSLWCSVNTMRKTERDQILKMLHNIQCLATELSKLEVEARRKRKFCYEELAAVNAAIKEVEQWILLGTLMQ